MQLVFLGTSCATPTKERNHSSIYLGYGSESILFDCGEGTQRQLRIAGIKPPKISKVFITHWHGDHCLGLSGLIQTLGLSEYDKTLKIYGPKGTKECVAAMQKACIFKQRISTEVHEIKEGKIYDGKGYIVEAYPIDHSTPTVGYRFVEKNKRRIRVSVIKKLGIPEGPLLGKLQQGQSIRFKGKEIAPKQATDVVKGKIIAYVPDSTPSKNSLKIAEDADILICESTYASKLKEKAEEYGHMTSKDAATIANNAGAKQLYLTHFSTRYKDTHELEEDAKDIFPNTITAKDFMKVNI